MAEPRFDLVELLQQLTRKPVRPARTHCRAQNPYHAVALRVTKRSCETAKALAERRFLAGEAPRLPLAECSAERCTCSYVHHDDRRQDLRRASDLDVPPPRFDGPNARAGLGRRKTDDPLGSDSGYFHYTAQRTDQVVARGRSSDSGRSKR